MAFQSKDGNRFTNHSAFKAHEGRLSRMGGGAKTPAGPMAGGGDPVGADPDQEQGGDPQDGAAMAQEHGPAVEVQVHHDHEAGKHSVHASHPDGHEHDTEHASADDAHKFAADCCGVGAEPAEGGDGGDGTGGMGMGGE